MAGVVLHQVELPLAALEHGVVGNLAPLVVVGPALDLLAHRAGQVVHRTAQILVVVEPYLVAVLHNAPRAVLDSGDVDT